MGRVRRLVGHVALEGPGQWRRARDKAVCTLRAGAYADFGAHSVLEQGVEVQGAHSIAIGDRVWIGTGSWLRVLGRADGGPRLVIGDGTKLAGNCTLAAVESITVGSDVLFARGVYVADHAHAFEGDGPPLLQGLDRIAPVVIEDGAWLGQNVVVGPGVTIGASAVVGANSVVTRDVDARSVVAGAPARELRRLAPQAVVGAA